MVSTAAAYGPTWEPTYPTSYPYGVWGQQTKAEGSTTDAWVDAVDQYLFVQESVDEMDSAYTDLADLLDDYVINSGFDDQDAIDAAEDILDQAWQDRYVTGNPTLEDDLDYLDASATWEGPQTHFEDGMSAVGVAYWSGELDDAETEFAAIEARGVTAKSKADDIKADCLAGIDPLVAAFDAWQAAQE